MFNKVSGDKSYFSAIYSLFYFPFNILKANGNIAIVVRGGTSTYGGKRPHWQRIAPLLVIFESLEFKVQSTKYKALKAHFLLLGYG